MVERVMAEICFGADEPAEGRRRPLEDLVPGSKPRKGASGSIPERVRVASRVVEPPLNGRSDEARGTHEAESIFLLMFVQREHRLLSIAEAERGRAWHERLEKLRVLPRVFVAFRSSGSRRVVTARRQPRHRERAAPARPRVPQVPGHRIPLLTI